MVAPSSQAPKLTASLSVGESDIDCPHRTFPSPMAEVAVKKCKRLLLENIGPSGSLNNDRLLRALLQVRNTPDPDCNISPAEIIFGRQIRDSFSFVNRLPKFDNPHIRST